MMFKDAYNVERDHDNYTIIRFPITSNNPFSNNVPRKSMVVTVPPTKLID